MTTLENAGYVQVIKGYHGKRPRTWLALTDAGRTAYTGYLTTLNEILGLDR
jgi:DNA-binding PadR family transcriptional regulator